MKNFINIALDGPSGSGKSTVAKALSSELNILYLDTGAMYRATALKTLELNIDTFDEEGVKTFIDDINLEIKYVDGAQRTFLDGIDVSEKIREPHVSMAASNVSSLRCVRLKMVDMQRKIADNMSCVLDGRDIGSYVLPNAKFKFYVTASSEVRALRRYKELVAKGHQVDLKELQKEIDQRDYNDKNRDFAPLKQAEDAIYLDTSDMSIDEVVSFILGKVKE
ncbi:MAG: (d)CMP kinase [Clostridia bacterium]|nr:(d)CMP kinase [Clostridia bacterium]